MKKIILCTVVAIILSNCELKMKEARADVQQGADVNYVDFTLEGMEYRVVKGSSQGGVAVINITKDKLQVEMLRKNLAK